MNTSHSTADSPVLATKRNWRFEDLIGKVFGRLTVVGEGSKKGKATRWQCSCACGGSALVSACDLKNSHTTSCGCAQKTAASKANSTHRMTDSSEYCCWEQMWDRCTNPNNSQFADYNPRTPPESWRSFEAFYADMGPRPSLGHSIDRRDNKLPYGPGNCRWATAKEQGQNTSTNVLVSLGDRVMCFKEACETLGLPYGATYGMYRRHGMLHASGNQFDLVKEK